eukprot:235157-Amorphochlora_amoeboformis.AAC.1
MARGFAGGLLEFLFHCNLLPSCHNGDPWVGMGMIEIFIYCAFDSKVYIEECDPPAEARPPGM